MTLRFPPPSFFPSFTLYLLFVLSPHRFPLFPLIIFIFLLPNTPLFHDRFGLGLLVQDPHTWIISVCLVIIDLEENQPGWFIFRINMVVILVSHPILLLNMFHPVKTYISLFVTSESYQLQRSWLHTLYQREKTGIKGISGAISKWNNLHCCLPLLYLDWCYLCAISCTMFATSCSFFNPIFKYVKEPENYYKHPSVVYIIKSSTNIKSPHYVALYISITPYIHIIRHI